jgi:uncharacterized SAM-binding protein YcdF (DUF218 family)
MWAAATLLLTLGALSGFTYGSRRASEYQYEPFSLATNESLNSEPSTIVVLGAGFNADEFLPPNSRVSSAYLARMLEGVRVHRLLPESKLVFSVAGKADASAKQAFVDGMIEILQLDAARVQSITDAESTDDEAESIKATHEGHPIVVVTSAGHMPRAMRIFEGHGLTAQAAPADYGFTRTASPNDKPWQRWTPSLDGLGSNAHYAYETVATLASRIKRMFL